MLDCVFLPDCSFSGDPDEPLLDSDVAFLEL